MRLAIYESANYKWIVFATVALGSITNVTHHGGVSIALPTIAQRLFFLGFPLGLVIL